MKPKLLKSSTTESGLVVVLMLSCSAIAMADGRAKPRVFVR